MTRSSLNQTLHRAYLLLFVLLAVAFLARLAEHIPGFPPARVALAQSIYEYMRDMALVFITVIAAYLANVFQKRSKFVESLEEEWRGIVRTKSALYSFCEKSFPTADDYIAAFCRISETLDNMRIVYSNAGETDELVGLYPYAPLHDMRRALQTLDPRKNQNITPEHRKLVRDAILQSFYALRENFLEELDLEAPDNPLLISGGRRLKKPGSTRQAKALQEQQKRRQARNGAGRREDVDKLLADLYAKEQGGA
jgi:hypothetical protein